MVSWSVIGRSEAISLKPFISQIGEVDDDDGDASAAAVDVVCEEKRRAAAGG